MQSAAEQIYDGSATALAAAGAGSTLSCSARPFVAADVDNTLNVTAGTNLTTGRYRIVSVAAGVATLDRAVSTGASSNGQGRLGGALATIGGALSAMVASNTIWVYGAHTTAATISGGTGGAGNLPSRIIGYTTTRAAALTATIADALYATLTVTNAAATTALSINGTQWIVQNLKIDGGTPTKLAQRCLFMATSSVTAFINHVWVTNWTQRGIHINSSNNSCIADCLGTAGAGGALTLSQSAAAFVFNGDGGMVRCVAKDCTTNGFCSDNGATQMYNCVAYNLDLETGVGGNGFYIFGATGGQIYNCTFADLAGSGILNPNVSAAAMGDFLIENNIFSNITRYGLESSSTDFSDSRNAWKVRKNAYFSNTLGQRSFFPAGTGEITLTASPFVDLATGDLDLNNTAGGGALCRATGIPGALPGLTLVTGYLDVGALQSGSGGTDHGTMVDLWRELTGEFSTTRVADTVVNRYLGLGLEEFQRQVGYSYADDTATTLVAGTQEYSQPADAVEIVWIEHAGKRLEKADLEEEERQERDWRNLPASTPTRWAHYGSKLVLIPKPDAAAVAAGSTLTVRYLRSPRDIATFGPEGLAKTDFQAIVFYAVYLWSTAHPDSATAQMRAAGFLEAFNRAVVNSAEFYVRRRFSRGAANEMLTASGVKRSKTA
jgi:hypothetical protein